MKKCIFLALSLMLGCSLVTMTSCSSDDDGEGGGNNGPGSVEAVNPAKVFPQGLPARVGGEAVTTDAEGRVTAIGSDVRFIYNSAEAGRAQSSYDMVMKVRYDGDPYTINISLNADGFVRYASSRDNEWTISYNSEGRISSIYHKPLDDDGISADYSVSYKNGNPVAMTAKGGGQKSTAKITYTDGSHSSGIINKGYYIMWYDGYGGFDFEELQKAYYAGLLGKGPELLPLKLEQELGSYSSTEEYDWTLDSNGYPASVFCSYEDYDDGELDEGSWTDYFSW